MTKIKGPLLSLMASGRYASSIIFRDTRHGAVATRFHYPGSRNIFASSAAQLENQAIYGALVAAWRALSPSERYQWNVDAMLFKISGWNLYLRTNFSASVLGTKWDGGATVWDSGATVWDV